MAVGSEVVSREPRHSSLGSRRRDEVTAPDDGRTANPNAHYDIAATNIAHPAVVIARPLTRVVVLCKHGRSPCDVCGTIVVYR